MPSAKKTTRTVEKSAPTVDLRTVLVEELKKTTLNPSARTAAITRILKRVVAAS